jgi:hypothetical protein
MEVKIYEHGQAINSQLRSSRLQRFASNDGAEGFKADATAGCPDSPFGVLQAFFRQDTGWDSLRAEPG